MSKGPVKNTHGQLSPLFYSLLLGKRQNTLESIHVSGKGQSLCDITQGLFSAAEAMSGRLRLWSLEALGDITERLFLEAEELEEQKYFK